MSLTNCRYYPEKYPEVDSYVMVNVKQVRSPGPLIHPSIHLSIVLPVYLSTMLTNGGV